MKQYPSHHNYILQYHTSCRTPHHTTLCHCITLHSTALRHITHHTTPHHITSQHCTTPSDFISPTCSQFVSVYASIQCFLVAAESASAAHLLSPCPPEVKSNKINKKINKWTEKKLFFVLFYFLFRFFSSAHFLFVQ